MCKTWIRSCRGEGAYELCMKNGWYWWTEWAEREHTGKREALSKRMEMGRVESELGITRMWVFRWEGVRGSICSN